MRKPGSLGLALLLAFLCELQTSSAQSVKIDYAKDYDFGALKRFSWKKNHLVTMRYPEDNQTWIGRSCAP